MTLNEFQKYKVLKSFVEMSYPNKDECKDVWHSVKRLILSCNEYDIRQDQLEIFFQMSETGKPLCHLDVLVNSDDFVSIFDVLDEPFVSYPFTHCLLVSDVAQNTHRFFFVNPDVSGAKDFSFKSKLALRDSYILLSSCEENMDNIANLNVPETAKFIIRCVLCKNRVKYAGVFEIARDSSGGITTVEFKNEEIDMQESLCKRIKKSVSDAQKEQKQNANKILWKWDELFQKSFNK
ncbi:hypothetical protein [Fibrobacter sp.]|uniref:hypothetical protein n=1 Tax=Fibrobacter sp. TaxID=35828 RepID=UPI0038701B69